MEAKAVSKRPDREDSGKDEQRATKRRVTKQQPGKDVAEEVRRLEQEEVALLRELAPHGSAPHVMQYAYDQDLLLAQRVETKLSGSRVEQVINRVRVAEPAPRDEATAHGMHQRSSDGGAGSK